jgi:hypothetical protein
MNSDSDWSLMSMRLDVLRSVIIMLMPQWFTDWAWLFLSIFVLVFSVGVYFVIRGYHPIFSGFFGLFTCGVAIYLCWVLIPVWLGWVLISWVGIVDIVLPSAVIVE